MSLRASAIVINYNGDRDLVKCLESLQGQGDALAEILVVDNASSDGSLDRARALFPEIRVVMNDINMGFAGAANLGGRLATGGVLLFLNPDVALSVDCLSQLVDTLEACPGVCGPRLLVGSDMQEEHGGTIDRLGYPIGLSTPGNPLYVSGCALATTRDYFDRLGGFDDRYFLFVEDVDYCWRVLLAGGNVTVNPTAYARHGGGGSAPGGYVRAGEIQTSPLRVRLRERNTLATLLKCAPVSWLLWLIPVYIAQTYVTAAAVLTMSQHRLAYDLAAGIMWNIRQLPDTYARRHGIPRSRSGEAAAMRRIHSGLVAIDRLQRFGLPRFVRNDR
jgi:GT2 family glycosyltransferase